jgi:hypothetical protein
VGEGVEGPHQVGSQHGVDWLIGRKLPGMIDELGLEHPGPRGSLLPDVHGRGARPRSCQRTPRRRLSVVGGFELLDLVLDDGCVGTQTTGLKACDAAPLATRVSPSHMGRTTRPKSGRREKQHVVVPAASACSADP